MTAAELSDRGQRLAELGGLDSVISEIARWRALFSSPEAASRELCRLRELAQTLKRERDVANDHVARIVRATDG